MYRFVCILGLVTLINIGVTAQNSNRPSASTDSNLKAQLQSMIDVRKAKIGDEVVLKTTQSTNINGVAFPKGSRIIGRVTDAQQRAKNGAASRLGLLFDRVQNRDQVTPITATIVSVTNLRATTSPDDTFDSTMSSSASTRASSNSGGGGLLGGVTNTVGGLVNSTTQTAESVTNTAVRTVSGTTQTVGQTVNGLQISTSAAASAQGSTTLSAPNKDIRLEKGVTFGLNVQTSAKN